MITRAKKVNVYKRDCLLPSTSKMGDASPAQSAAVLDADKTVVAQSAIVLRVVCMCPKAGLLGSCSQASKLDRLNSCISTFLV